MDTAAIDRYVGTFTNDDQSVTLNLTREGRTLIIGRLPAEFLSLTRLAVRDGTEIAVTLDASGRAVELRRGRLRLTRK